MKRLNKGLLFFCFIPATFFLFLLSGCTLSSLQEALPEGPYFSLTAYFSKEAARCGEKKIQLKKSVFKDGTPEEKVVSDPSWAKEFSLFSGCDLNKKAWESLYHTDTVWEASGMKVRYVSTDSSLQVKRVEIFFQHDSVQEISMESRFRNFYYRSDLFLQYKPTSGFFIRGSQAIRFFSSHQFEIQGRFL